MGGIAKASVDAVAITRCIKVRTAKERTFSLYIQDVVSGFLPKEVPLGSPITLYVIRIFASPDGQGVVVNEFATDKRAGETGQGSQVANASGDKDTEKQQASAGSNTAIAISVGEWRRAGAGFVCIAWGKRLPKPPDPGALAKACLHMGPFGIGDPVQSLTSVLGAAHRMLPQPNEASALIYFLGKPEQLPISSRPYRRITSWRFRSRDPRPRATASTTSVSATIPRPWQRFSA